MTTNVDSTLGLAPNRSAASRPETPSVVRSRTATIYASSPVAQTIQGRTPNLSNAEGDPEGHVLLSCNTPQPHDVPPGRVDANSAAVKSLTASPVSDGN